PPAIAVRTPEGDLDLPTGQQLPLEVLGQDDLGLSELRLQYRKDSAAPWTDVPLARFEKQPREARYEGHWDASALALLPGETATFRFELFDDNAVSGRGVAVSPGFELRFPSLAELYEHVDATQGGVQTTLEKAAEKTRELQKSLDHMSRQATQRATPSTSPTHERSEELKNALDRQQDISQQIDQASEKLRESIEQAAEREAFNQQITAKLKEMAELLQQIQSPEFREALKRMRESLERLDHRPVEQQLPQWRDQNREMLENLERTLALLKLLRQEEKLGSLEQSAQDMQQEASPAQREASRAAGRLERQKAAQSGKRASQSLQRASERLQSMLAQRAQQRDGANLAAVRRAAQDLNSLQRAAEENLAAPAP